MKKERQKFGDFFGAIIIILIGTILLLNNFDILPFSIWAELWHFWPVLLIVAGLQMLGGDSSLAESLVSLIGIAILILVILFALSSVDRNFDNWMRKQFPQWPRMYRRFESFEREGFKLRMFNSNNLSI